MARIAGVDLPRDKRVEYALLSIFGIGLTSSRDILSKNGVSLDTRVRDLTEAETAKLRDTIEREFRVEGDLKRQIQINIRRLRRSAATGASGTARACPCAARRPRAMPAPVAARAAPSPARRN